MASSQQRFAATLGEFLGLAPSRTRVDMAVSLRVAEVANENGSRRWLKSTDDELAEFGGTWDRRAKRWIGDAHAPVVLRLHRGQEPAARWFAEWLHRHVTGDWTGFRKVWTAMLIGGRRSGKSHLAAVMMAVFAIATPGAVIVAVSPTLEHGLELERALESLLDRDVYRRFAGNTGKSVRFKLANGATIFLRSGAKAGFGGLKIGRVDLAVLNEGQLMKKRAHTHLRGAVGDTSGLVIITANPADSEAGRWIEDLWLGIEAQEIDGVGWQLDPRANPWIDYSVLASQAKEVDRLEFEREVLGHFTSIGEVVMHAFAAENIREPWSGLVDITAAVTRRELKHAAGFVCGIDLQRSPACVLAVLKVFSDPQLPGEELAFVIDEFIGKDEDELGDAIESSPIWRPGNVRGMEQYRFAASSGDNPNAPAHVAAVLDASAWWQDSAHSQGRQSDRIFRARGWRALFKPNRESDRNPDIAARMRLANARLCNAEGVRRLFVSPRCVQTVEAFRRYPNVHGKPDRRHPAAHWIDAATYPLFALWGSVRLKGNGKSEYRGIREGVTRERELAAGGWGPGEDHVPGFMRGGRK